MIGLNRRTFLLAAGAALLPGRVAAARRIEVPEVDFLSVQFLVDGTLFGLAQPIRRPGLLVEPPRRLVAKEQRLLGEWGLSLLIEARSRRSTNRTMLDFGYSGTVLANNMAVLGVAPESIEALVLSHGHYDHFGGIDALLETGRLRRGTPLYIGGEEAMCRRLRGLEGSLDFGELDQVRVRAAGVEIRVVPDPFLVGGGFTTGRIPLGIERPRTPTRMMPGVGCARERLDPDKRDLDLVVDDSRHELGLAYNLKGRGLVVIGSCSHRGILNTIHQARRVSGVEKVHAVIGGFHLVQPQTEADAKRTAAALAQIGVDFVVPGHCSGEWFIAEAERVMGGKVIRPYVGHRFLFGTAV